MWSFTASRAGGFACSGPPCWQGDGNIPCVDQLRAWLLRHGYAIGQGGETLLSKKDLQRSVYIWSLSPGKCLGAVGERTISWVQFACGERLLAA